MSEADKANEKQTKKVAKKAKKKKDSKDDQVKAIIGEYTSVTRKVKLEAILLPKYRDLTATFIEVSEQIRNIVVRSQIFHNMFNKRKIAEEYCYGKACGLPSTWPELKSSVSEEGKVLIDDACNKLIEVDIPRPATLGKLGASPGSYIPMLRYILAIYEEEHHKAQQDQEIKSDLPRLFALTPAPSFRFRSISITPSALKVFTSDFKKLPNTFVDNQTMFFKIFDLSKLKLKSINEQDTNNNHRKEVFSNLLRIDGYSADSHL
ncbi:hypothetical protein RMATCC62417_17093 [Rhizopus microsporus]|nr:hypothetical protein RMATCC62417_17093 [Rhizopus microsporus]